MVGCRGQFATVLRGSGLRYACCCMLPKSHPMVPPSAHRSYELSLSVSRQVPDVSSVQARFHSRRVGFHVSTKGTMFQARLHPKGMPCRQSTLTTLQYHCQGRKRLIGGGSGCLDGQQWWAVGGSLQLLSGGQGADTQAAACSQSPTQWSPQLPMGRVSASGQFLGPCRLTEAAETC